MLHQTRGISLHTLKFSETSIIAKIYTEHFGLQSYLIKGVRKPHSKIRSAFFQPLTILDLTVYHKEKNTLHSIREAHILYPYQTLPFDIRKSSVALFINEIVYRSVREEEPNQGLFDFLHTTCMELDNTAENIRILPVQFMVRFARHLGIIPESDTSGGKVIFNMKDGTFQGSRPDHNQFLVPPLSTALNDLIREEVNDANTDATSKEEIYNKVVEVRHELLDKLLTYYHLHLPGIGEIRSHRVLHTVLA